MFIGGERVDGADRSEALYPFDGSVIESVPDSATEDIETAIASADLMPFGGLKESGIGREGPKYAIEEMTDLKMVVYHP